MKEDGIKGAIMIRGVLGNMPLQEASQWHLNLAEFLLKEKNQAEITFAICVPPYSPSKQFALL